MTQSSLVPTLAQSVTAPCDWPPLTHEHAAIFFYAIDDQLLHVESCPTGDIDHVALPLRTIVSAALAIGAHHIVIAHNHPSGDPRPSAQDIAATRLLCRTLRPLGIDVTDHLIWTEQTQFSFRANGLL